MYTSPSIPCSSLIFIPPRVEISTEIAAVLKTVFEAIWTAPGRLLASILDQNGVDFGPPGAVREISTQNAPQSLRKPHRPATWLQERLGRLLARFYTNVASILASIFDPQIIENR